MVLYLSLFQRHFQQVHRHILYSNYHQTTCVCLHILQNIHFQGLLYILQMVQYCKCMILVDIQHLSILLSHNQKYLFLQLFCNCQEVFYGIQNYILTSQQFLLHDISFSYIDCISVSSKQYHQTSFETHKKVIQTNSQIHFLHI